MLNQERDVVIRTAVADHTNGDIFQCHGGLAFETFVAPSQIAHYADDAHVLINDHRAHFFEFIDDCCESTCVVNAERYAHFARGDHINRGVVLVEYVENLAHEATSQQHTRAYDLNGRDYCPWLQRL